MRSLIVLFSMICLSNANAGDVAKVITYSGIISNNSIHVETTDEKISIEVNDDYGMGVYLKTNTADIANYRDAGIGHCQVPEEKEICRNIVNRMLQVLGKAQSDIVVTNKSAQEYDGEMAAISTAQTELVKFRRTLLN
jgi:hypothetical protein